MSDNGENNVMNIKTHHNGVMGTYTGKKLDIFHFTPDELDIMDIFHPLTLICRFGGHIRKHFSVAQHSLLVEYIVEWHQYKIQNLELPNDNERLHGLLHDGSDSLLGDMPRPLKYTEEMGLFRSTENDVQMKINAKFGLPLVEKTPAVAFADEIALAIEANNLTLGKRSWAEEIRMKSGDTIQAYDCAERFFKQIENLDPTTIKIMMFEKFYNLVSSPYFTK